METLIKEEQKDLGTKVNIKQFSLSADVKEDGEEIKALRKYVRTGDISLIQQFLDSGKIIDSSETHNIIVDDALAEYCKAIANKRATVPYINYGALGTGIPNVNPAQHKLVNEVYRKVTSSLSCLDNAIFADFFFTASEVAGTFTEFGNFIDGTAVKDSGTLNSSVATGGWVKPISLSLFISCEYHLNNA
jgi:hypothetical protein